jgi:hypothetical protein
MLDPFSAGTLTFIRTIETFFESAFATVVVSTTAAPQPRPTLRGRSSRRPASGLWRWKQSRHRGWVGMSLPRERAPSAHVGVHDQMKGGHEESSNHAAADWARESSSSWARAGHRSSSSVIARAINTRAFALATPVTAGPITTIVMTPTPSNIGYHQQQMLIGWQFVATSLATLITSSTSAKIPQRIRPS